MLSSFTEKQPDNGLNSNKDIINDLKGICLCIYLLII